MATQLKNPELHGLFLMYKVQSTLVVETSPRKHAPFFFFWIYYEINTYTLRHLVSTIYLRRELANKYECLGVAPCP